MSPAATHSSPIPPSPEVVKWAAAQRHDVPLETPWIDELTQFNTETGQRGRSWTLPVAEGAAARIPVWTSRADWLRQVRYAATEMAEGRAACRKEPISVERLVAVAAAHAHFAESATGRGVTASVSTLCERAGVSKTVVSRARRVLKVLGLGHELTRGRTLSSREYQAAELHHGGHQHRAASVWVLSSPAALVVAAPTPKRTRRRGIGSTCRPHTMTARCRPPRRGGDNPQVNGGGTLSPSGSFPEGFSRQGELTKHARTRAGNRSTRKNIRPLTLQRAAAALVAAAPAVAPPIHIGAVCDVLNRVGIDTQRWTGREVARALTADTVTRGETWPHPSEVQNPVAFLSYRLARIDWTGPSPTERARFAGEQRKAEQDRMRADWAARDAGVASAEHRAATMATITAQLRKGRR